MPVCLPPRFATQGIQSLDDCAIPPVQRRRAMHRAWTRIKEINRVSEIKVKKCFGFFFKGHCVALEKKFKLRFEYLQYKRGNHIKSKGISFPLMKKQAVLRGI